MKSFLHASLLLAPLIGFWELAGLGAPTAGAAAGTLAAAAIAFWSHRRHDDLLLPAGLTVILGLATLAPIGAADVAGSTIQASASAAAGLLMLGGVAAGRPWTAAISAPDWPGMTADPIFLRVNRAMSLIWAAVVAWSGIAAWASLGPSARWAPMAAAVGLALWLPPRWVRRALETRLAQADPNPWPSPLATDRRAGDDADVVVIGAGLGGLTAAALLARAGARVAVFEQHDKPGGFAHHWLGFGPADAGSERLVFRFDAGVHDISGWFAGGTVHALLHRLGLAQAIDWRPLDHCFVDDTGPWHVPRGWDAFADSIARRFPADAAALHTVLALIRRIHAGMYATAAARGGVPGQPTTVRGLQDFARAQPEAVHWLDARFVDLLAAHGVGTHAGAAVLGLAGYLTHRPGSLRVREYVPILGYFIHGGVYPAGGSGRLAESLADSIRLDGGSVHLRSPVAQILMDGPRGSGVAQGVRLADGRLVRSAAVVLNGEPLGATRGLLPESVLRSAFGQALRALEPTASMFSVHLGLRGELGGLAPVNHLRVGGRPLEVVLPSLADPSAAPPGHHTMVLMQLLEPAAARDWFEHPTLTDPLTQRRDPAYARRKAAFAEPMIDAATRLVPDLRDRIVYRSEASPVSFRRYGWSTNGAVYGTSHPRSPLTRRTPIPGLVIAGASTRGPGVEAAMISGAEAADGLLPGLLSGRAPALEPRGAAAATRAAGAIRPA